MYSTYLPFGPVKGMTLGSVAVSRAFNQRYLMTGIAAGSVMNLVYTHDGAGNVKSVSGLSRPPLVPGTTDYAHTANRLVSSSGFSAKSYSYDNVGNITSDGARTFDYDQSNRLIRVTEGSVVLADYAYDAFNRRVKKVADGETVYFHYDADGLLICETDAGGNAVRDYVYLNGEPVAMRVSGSWYWFICDHLGTPQKMVNSSGVVVWEAAYLPFGKARVLTANVENNLRFPGQYFDEETGLHYNWHRYYDPELGRYITADPIGLDGGVNLYAYAVANPLNSWDTDGLNPVAARMAQLGAGAMAAPVPGGRIVGSVLFVGSAAYAAYHMSKANDHPCSMSDARVKTNQQFHRGRIQAQGGGIEMSVNWAQSEPLSYSQGKALLEELTYRLSSFQREQRYSGIIQASMFMKNAAANGGVGPTSQTFLEVRYSKKPGSIKDPKHTRIDIEVNEGMAFVPY